jgi:hypothetical protein
LMLMGFFICARVQSGGAACILTGDASFLMQLCCFEACMLRTLGGVRRRSW